MFHFSWKQLNMLEVDQHIDIFGLKMVTYENYSKLVVKEKEKLKKVLKDLNSPSLSSSELPGTPCFDFSDYFPCDGLETLFKEGFDFFLI